MTAVDPSTQQPLGRRARNRVARHDQLLAAASEIVDESGLDGLTMQGVADRVDCAVGTIYTYFDSKSALVGALQSAAVQTLLNSYHRAAELWDVALEESGHDDPAVGSLVRVLAYGQLFVACPRLHPQEFELLQDAITSRVNTVAERDLGTLTTYAMTLLAEGVVLIETAIAAGALSAPDAARGDDSMSRILRWVGALDGALLVAGANVTALDAGDAGVFDSDHLALLCTEDMLLAWGAPAMVLTEAVQQLNRMQRAGQFLPRVGTNA